MVLTHLLKLRRRVVHQRSKKLNLFVRILPPALVLGGILAIGFVSAETVSVQETVLVTGRVYGKTVNPAPPPQPNPVPNNGVPLAPQLSGTDSATFTGFAYPGAIISILKNGLVLNETSVNQDGSFSVPVKNIIPGTYTFTLQAKDSNGVKSAQVSYTIMIESGIVTVVSGVIMPPTITTDKTEVKLGDTVILSGYAIPNKEVNVNIFARNGVVKSLFANASGVWSYTLSTSNYDAGDYNVKARTKVNEEYTKYSEVVLFTIGNKNTARKKGLSSLINARCDLNNDSRVNLLDFSIMAFWYKRLGFPSKVDLNSDGRINLTDLSILAYCWTG